MSDCQSTTLMGLERLQAPFWRTPPPTPPSFLQAVCVDRHHNMTDTYHLLMANPSWHFFL